MYVCACVLCFPFTQTCHMLGGNFLSFYWLCISFASCLLVLATKYKYAHKYVYKQKYMDFRYGDELSLCICYLFVAFFKVSFLMWTFLKVLIEFFIKMKIGNLPHELHWKTVFKKIYKSWWRRLARPEFLLFLSLVSFRYINGN